jgi:hypothetical protein
MKSSLGDGRKGWSVDQNQPVIIAAHPSPIFQTAQAFMKA